MHHNVPHDTLQSASNTMATPTVVLSTAKVATSGGRVYLLFIIYVYTSDGGKGNWIEKETQLWMGFHYCGLPIYTWSLIKAVDLLANVVYSLLQRDSVV